MALSDEERKARKLARNRRWRRNNPDKVRASNERQKENRRAWRKCNLESSRESTRKWRDANPSKGREYHLKAKFGISVQDYDRLLTSQNFSCAICGDKYEDRNYNIDHDHTTGKIRGLLCNNCNRGIGHLKDSVFVLSKAIEYLTIHKE